MKKYAWLLLFIPLLGACTPDRPYVILAGKTYNVEVVSKPGDLQLGLMFRRSMPKEHGMLFIFEDESERSFWMKNTRIPLDILFFDRDFKLDSQQLNAKPCKADPCKTFPSEGKAMYVLELNAGEASSLNLKRGMSLEYYP